MRTLHGFLCLIVWTWLPLAWAASLSSPKITYYPTDFYSQVESGLRDQPLKDQLLRILASIHRMRPGQHDVIQSSCHEQSCYRHISLGYTAARRLLFGQLHLATLTNGYAIRDVYCNRLVSAEGPAQIPDPRVMNTEHTWPQSRFSSRYDRDQQKSDLHILYPVLAHANSSRSNYEFGDVVTVTSSPCSEARRGYTSRGGRKFYFEAPHSHKGNAARAIFYFSTRYDLKIHIEEEDSLRAWHRADPVDSEEQARNVAIFENQKVRNPFIDHPELVELISDF